MSLGICQHGCCRPAPTRLQKLWRHLTTITVELDCHGEVLIMRTLYTTYRPWYKVYLWVYLLPWRIFRRMLPIKVAPMNFDTFNFPQIEKVAPHLLAEDLISVQPLQSPIRRGQPDA